MPHTPSITHKSKRTHAILQSILSIVSFVVCTAICSGADLGSGYLFYKEQGFHPDSRAIVKEVVSFEVFPAISRGKTKTGQLLQITAGQGPIFLPDPNGAALPDDVARQIKQLATKYPQHQVLLDKLLAVCSSKQKAPPAAPLATPSTAAALGGSPAENKADFYVVLADGTKVQNIKTAAITEDSIKLISDEGIRTVPTDSIQLSLSNLSPDAKAVVEKGQAAAEAKRKADADRIAAEKKEQERIAKEDQDKRLAEVEPAKLTDRPTSGGDIKPTATKPTATEPTATEPTNAGKKDPEIDIEQDTMFKDMIGRLARKPGFNIQGVSGGGVVMMLKAILDDNPEVALKKDEKTGATLLLFAVIKGYKSVVEVLLAHKADMNFTMGDEHYTALHIAADKGHAELVRLFLAQGADVNSTDSDGWTPLVSAAKGGHEEVIDLLLKNKSDVNFKAKGNVTPLNFAALNGHDKAIEALLAGGAEVDDRDSQGNTALHVAAFRGQEKAVAALLAHKADPNAKNSKGNTAIQLAKIKSNVGVENLVRKYGGRGSLFDEAKAGNLEAVKSMLEAKPTQISDTDPETGFGPLHGALENNHNDVAALLIDRGATVNAAAKNSGLTPLHIAASKGNEPMAKLLIDKGAEVDSKDKFGSTPLVLAAGGDPSDMGHENKEGNAAVARLLLANGADVNNPTSVMTPLALAYFCGQDLVAKVLLEYGGHR